MLASRPDLLAQLEGRIKSTVSGDLGQQLVNLMDSAIDSRTSVGIIGLATAAWAGLGWMRESARSAEPDVGTSATSRQGFVRTKLSDLLALLSAFVAIVVTIGLTALGDPSV